MLVLLLHGEKGERKMKRMNVKKTTSLNELTKIRGDE